MRRMQLLAVDFPISIELYISLVEECSNLWNKRLEIYKNKVVLTKRLRAECR